jgi:hypothetical protein
MKRVLLGLVGAAIFGAVPALAQGVIITPEESVLVERYVVQEPALPPPVTIEEHQTLRPGSIVPTGVPLQPFRGVSELGKFAYFVSVDNKVVVVDPATRVVVRIFNARS